MEWLETLNLLQKGRSPKTKQVFCTEASHWLMAIRCSLCCCFSFLMENQGQRELKMIRHVYGVLVIHWSVPKDCLAHNFYLATPFKWERFLGLILYPCRNVWPVILELSNGKNDLHFQTMDKYCDDLLWLESLIDGWGQTLTLITEKFAIIVRITDQILITSFLQPNVALMVSCTPSNNICCALFRLTFFFGLIPRLQVMMIHSIRKYCEGYSSSTGLKNDKISCFQSSVKTL